MKKLMQKIADFTLTLVGLQKPSKEVIFYYKLSSKILKKFLWYTHYIWQNYITRQFTGR